MEGGVEQEAVQFESESVHKVYNAIAPHFSNTRYKALPLGSLVADVGCGNGKYMGVNTGCCFIGCDRSIELANICHARGFQCMVCDNLYLPYRSESMDAVISIAVIHHMSTRERRIQAIRELFRLLRHGGTMLITVWAFEQKNKTYTEQDVMIPWHLQEKYHSKDNQTKGKQRKPKKPTNPKRRGPAESKDNEEVKEEAEDQAQNNQGVENTEEERKEKFVVYNRYYHLFKEGELEDLAKEIEGLQLVECAYDHDNWYLFAKKG